MVLVFASSGPATPETHSKARDWATAVVVHWPGMKYVYTLKIMEIIIKNYGK